MNDICKVLAILMAVGALGVFALLGIAWTVFGLIGAMV